LTSSACRIPPACCFDVFVARDGQAWAYSLTRMPSNLFAADGVQ
jgi:hypothetical protein